MRIVHWAKYYPPEWGGTELVTYDEAVAASAAGDDVAVVAFTRDEARKEVDKGVAIERAKVFAGIDSQPLSLRWLKAAIDQARNADVVHLHAPNLLAALALPFLSRRTRLIVQWQTDVVDKGLFGLLVRPLENYMARRADVLIANSEAYARASRVLQRHHEKTIAIPIGIADPTRSTASQRLPTDIARFVGERPLVLAVGRNVPYKGFEYLIRAAAEMRSDAAIVIVGTGPLETQHRRLISELDLGGRVLMAGRVNHADLQALFRAAALYAMSSCKRSEAYGIVLLEAMAYSLPIVATDIPGSGVAWVAGEGETGPIVPPGDPSALAGAIDLLLENPARRAELSRRSRTRYERLFTLEKMLAGVLSLYRKDSTASRRSQSGGSIAGVAADDRSNRSLNLQ